MSLHRRAPRHLAGALSDLQKNLAPETVMGEVQSLWIPVVGELIASEAKPVSERAGVLTVSCSAAVWAQELELMSGTILTALNERLRRGRISRLRCVVGGAR